MTVTDKPTIYKWVGNGVNKEFDFNVRLNNASELKVYLESAPEDILINGVDYEIKDITQGGESFPIETSTIIYPLGGSSHSILAEGEKIVLILDIPFEQKKVYREGGITGSSLEESLDENVRMMQVLRQKLTVVDDVKADVDTKIENVNVALTKLDEINALHDECKNYADNAQSSKNDAEESYNKTLDKETEIVNKANGILAQIEQTGIDNKANRNLDNIDWNNLDQRAKDSLGATIKTYNNVVYGVAKTIAFNGDYSTFSAVDISSYADGTYRVFAKTSSAIIPKTYTEGAIAPTNPIVGDVWKYIPAEPAEGEEQTACYKEYVTVTVPATEDGAEDTTTNEWQVVELTELAQIKTTDGTLSEVMGSVQYSTEEPLQEVDLHTQTSYADSIGQVQSNKLPLIPFNFTSPNRSDYVAVTANTECKYSRDGVFYPTAVAKIVLTEADGTVTEFPAKLELKLKAGDKFTSTVAGKFYFYY